VACSPKRSEEIGDLAAGRLGPLEAQDLLEHLEGCGACSEELDLVADLVAATAEPGGKPSVSPRSRFLSPGLAVLAAAAAILAALGIWRLVPGWGGGGGGGAPGRGFYAATPRRAYAPNANGCRPCAETPDRLPLPSRRRPGPPPR